MSSKIDANLRSIQKYLQKDGVDCTLQPPVEHVTPNEQLVVNLGKDDGQDLLLRIFFTSDFKTDENEVEEDIDINFLQFYLLFPFEINEGGVHDFTLLLLNLNATLDMAYFGVLPGEKFFHYKYCHICTDQQIDERVLITVIGTIGFLIESFLKILKDVALGKKNLETVRKEAQELILEE